MSEQYGLKEYKELLEKNLREIRNPMSSPFGSDPHSVQETLIRHAKMESINYAIEMLPEVDPDAERYRKLRRWMSSGIQVGWDEVAKLGAIATYLGWDDFDAELDRLPVCNIGLCEVQSERS